MAAPGTRFLLMTQRAVACRGKWHACSGRTLCTGGPSLKDVRVRLLPQPHKLSKSEREESEKSPELLCTSSRVCLSIRPLFRQERRAPLYSRSLSRYALRPMGAMDLGGLGASSRSSCKRDMGIQVKEKKYPGMRRAQQERCTWEGCVRRCTTTCSPAATGAPFSCASKILTRPEASRN